MFEWFDPTNWFITFQDYQHWWFYMVDVLFKGFWAKIIASLCLLISVHSVVRRKFRPIIGLLCFFVSIFFAYAGAVINWFSK